MCVHCIAKNVNLTFENKFFYYPTLGKWKTLERLYCTTDNLFVFNLFSVNFTFQKILNLKEELSVFFFNYYLSKLNKKVIKLK
jgi:hypothetical protein